MNSGLARFDPLLAGISSGSLGLSSICRSSSIIGSLRLWFGVSVCTLHSQQVVDSNPSVVLFVYLYVYGFMLLGK